MRPWPLGLLACLALAGCSSEEPEGSPVAREPRDPCEAVTAQERPEIAFSRGFGAGELWTVRDDGSEVRPLGGGVAGGLPAWSPDGCEVAFIASLPVTEGPPESSVVIAAGDGSDPRTLYTGASILSRPEWSPDGQEVAFTSLETDQLVKLPVTGGRPRDLSPGDLDVAGPVAWSPDGAQIVLAGSAEDKRRPDLYAVRSDGGGLRQLTDTAGGEESPDWSPDGRRLAFAAYAAGGYYEDRAIVVARADGSERTRLTQDLDSNPVWSPDGRSIVFERTTTPLEETPSTADTELWVVDVDSGEERRLVAAPALEPFWSPATEAP